MNTARGAEKFVFGRNGSVSLQRRKRDRWFFRSNFSGLLPKEKNDEQNFLMKQTRR